VDYRSISFPGAQTTFAKKPRDGSADRGEKEAMWFEIGRFDKFGVYETHAREEVKDTHKTLSSKWVKSEGPDGVKMRFVGRELKWANPRDDVFTAASTANTERVVDACAAKKKQKTAILDAKNAYLEVGETEKIFV